MNLRASILKFLKFAFLLLFLGCYSGITLFYHVHLVNGQLVAHSHFYKGEAGNRKPVAKHTHATSAYHIISQHQKVCVDELIISSLFEQPLLNEQSILRYVVRPDIKNTFLPHTPSRAPPTC
jgi:hypothetical protein